MQISAEPVVVALSRPAPKSMSLPELARSEYVASYIADDRPLALRNKIPISESNQPNIRQIPVSQIANLRHCYVSCKPQSSRRAVGQRPGIDGLRPERWE
jgi:hypothetical protein